MAGEAARWPTPAGGRLIAPVPDGRPNDNWPKDERSADKKPTEMRVKFRVVAKVEMNEQ